MANIVRVDTSSTEDYSVYFQVDRDGIARISEREYKRAVRWEYVRRWLKEAPRDTD